jgi:phosphate/sulfate permease
MENIYLIIVVVLFALAISDLVVGVSNDAVNFLNSAIGSKVAPFKIIMLIAALGILFGATFSSGMMEVARKGIFHPSNYYFSEIMVIFLAVMLTDIILLDLFNTFGLPTSTTVSIVFELLGASVAVALIKISNSPESVTEMSNYINTGNALLIIMGILLSVVVAFTVGAVIQYVSRAIFSFDYQNILKYAGSIYGGVAVAAITFFMLLKGASGSSFMTDQTVSWIQNNTGTILLVSFLFWTILFQLLYWIFKVNVLKVIVLIGTFALAMAFAGNDLVNFIGVPLAGYQSFKEFSETPGADPGNLSMTALQEQVQTPTLFLLAAGIIMVATLWLSKKAKSVVKTEVDLGRQEEGQERFKSSMFARSLVGMSITISKGVSSIVPQRIKSTISQRFDMTSFNERAKQDKASFDLIRASVNLIVASILIAFATSLKLPLSTTYVTFMVAMGTSLADGAWDRESAVYRISGVVTVIGGWFFTAFMAFTVSFLIASIISWGGITAIAILVLLAIFFVVRTQAIFMKRKKKDEEFQKEEAAETNVQSLYEGSKTKVISTLNSVYNVYAQTTNGLLNEDRKLLKTAQNKSKTLNKEISALHNGFHRIVRKLDEDYIESLHHFVHIGDYLRETAKRLNNIVKPSHLHIRNHHASLNKYQSEHLIDFSGQMLDFTSNVIIMVENDDFSAIGNMKERQKAMTEKISDLRKQQIKILKKNSAKTKATLLYLEILSESKSLLISIAELVEAERDFHELIKQE